MSFHKDPKYRMPALIAALQAHHLEHDKPSQLADAFRCGWVASQAEAPKTKVLTEHGGCGHGTQVDQLTVRLNPGDKVVLVMGRYSAAVDAAHAAKAVSS